MLRLLLVYSWDNILYCTRIAYLVLCCNVKTLTLMDVNMSLEQETLNIMVVKINGFTVPKSLESFSEVTSM